MAWQHEGHRDEYGGIESPEERKYNFNILLNKDIFTHDTEAQSLINTLTTTSNISAKLALFKSLVDKAASVRGDEIMLILNPDVEFNVFAISKLLNGTNTPLTWVPDGSNLVLLNEEYRFGTVITFLKYHVYVEESDKKLTIIISEKEPMDGGGNCKVKYAGRMYKIRTEGRSKFILVKGERVTLAAARRSSRNNQKKWIAPGSTTAHGSR